MDKTTKKIFGVVAVLFVVVFGWLLHGSSSQPASNSQYGSTVDPNPFWYPAGLATGQDSGLYDSNVLTLSTGQNQASFQNTTGSNIKIMTGQLETSGTASTTMWFNVGTSTTASVSDVFTPGTTAPMWSQFISSFSLATGTVTGLWADNVVNHKTNYPAEILVTPGQYFILTANTYCTTVGSCETATSTNRGWTAKLIFRFYKSGGN